MLKWEAPLGRHLYMIYQFIGNSVIKIFDRVNVSVENKEILKISRDKYSVIDGMKSRL